MGRAIDQEKEIDQIKMRLNELTEHVVFIQQTLTKLIEFSQGEPDEPKKKSAKKKKSKASDGAKDNISNK